MAKAKIDLTGNIYGDWTVIDQAPTRNGNTYWNCVCICGTQKPVIGSGLKNGTSKSCGCSIRKFEDLTGKVYGYWTVISQVERKNGYIYWECLCKCGKNRDVLQNNLISRHSTSCGCVQVLDLAGQKYGKLTAVSIHSNINGVVSWLCICDCGNEIVLRRGNLRSKATSCGCLTSELISKATTRHGMRHTTEYNIWDAMRQRCGNPNNKAYSLYGGRGIKVCKRWENSFENFYEDMGPRPQKLTLDRIDNNSGYSKDNCRWITYFEQCRNKRNNSETVGLRQLESGSWNWRTIASGTLYGGTCKLKIDAKKAYDDKCEELGRGRPNNT